MTAEIFTTDNDLPRSIEHRREHVVVDGRLEQDYRYLVYRFEALSGEIVARTYFDDNRHVALIVNPGTAIPPGVMAYLQQRFDRISALGSSGYSVVWATDD